MTAGAGRRRLEADGDVAQSSEGGKRRETGSAAIVGETGQLVRKFEE